MGLAPGAPGRLLGLIPGEIGAAAGASRTGGASGGTTGTVGIRSGGSGTPRSSTTPISISARKLRMPTWYAPAPQPAFSKVDTMAPYSSGPVTALNFPAIPYRPKNSPTLSGGDSRSINTRSDVQTPPSPAPSSAPPIRNVGYDRTRPTMSRPAHHVPSTMSSVRFGPIRSTRRPQPRLAKTATTVSSNRTMLTSPLDRPIASVAKTVITTITVLTGSV